jgi:predicted aspartyl protease
MDGYARCNIEYTATCMDTGFMAYCYVPKQVVQAADHQTGTPGNHFHAMTCTSILS